MKIFMSEMRRPDTSASYLDVPYVMKMHVRAGSQFYHVLRSEETPDTFSLSFFNLSTNSYHNESGLTCSHRSNRS